MCKCSFSAQLYLHIWCLNMCNAYFFLKVALEYNRPEYTGNNINIPGHHASASTVVYYSIYNGFYIIFCHVTPFTSEEDTEAAGQAPRVLPWGWIRLSRRVPENICTVSMHLTREEDQQAKNMYVHMAVTNFPMVNCSVVSNDFCQLIELSCQIQIIFNEQHLSYICYNINLYIFILFRC